MPLNFLERPVEFQTLMKGLDTIRGKERGGVRSIEEGSGEGQEERCRRQSHTVLTTA